MSKIVNEYVKGDEIVEAVRSAIEFRATWMGLIFDEMRKAGVDAEGITRRAITRCGHLDGKKIKAAADGKEVDGNDICKFSFRDLMRRCFQMDPVTSDENNADAWLHYCLPASFALPAPPPCSVWLRRSYSGCQPAGHRPSSVPAHFHSACPPERQWTVS